MFILVIKVARQFLIKCQKQQEKEESQKLAGTTTEKQGYLQGKKENGKEADLGSDSEIMVFCGFCLPKQECCLQGLDSISGMQTLL